MQYVISERPTQLMLKCKNPVVESRRRGGTPCRSQVRFCAGRRPRHSRGELSLMRSNRATVVALGIVLILSIWFIFLLSFLSGSVYAHFLWGVLIGSILGIATCFYLASTWDPVNLRPIDPNTKKADNKIFWVVPIGIILARLLPDLVGKEITDLIVSCVLVWITFTIGYMTIQGWRYRPK